MLQKSVVLFNTESTENIQSMIAPLTIQMAITGFTLKFDKCTSILYLSINFLVNLQTYPFL